jgi:polyferredoxin
VNINSNPYSKMLSVVSVLSLLVFFTMVLQLFGAVDFGGDSMWAGTVLLITLGLAYIDLIERWQNSRWWP